MFVYIYIFFFLQRLRLITFARCIFFESMHVAKLFGDGPVFIAMALGGPVEESRGANCRVQERQRGAVAARH